MKYYTLWLPYFKQGDDLNQCLEQAHDDIYKALRFHADQLAEACKILSKLSDIAKDYKIDIDADTHHIVSAVAKKLQK